MARVYGSSTQGVEGKGGVGFGENGGRSSGLGEVAPGIGDDEEFPSSFSLQSPSSLDRRDRRTRSKNVLPLGPWEEDTLPVPLHPYPNHCHHTRILSPLSTPVRRRWVLHYWRSQTQGHQGFLGVLDICHYSSRSSVPLPVPRSRYPSPVSPLPLPLSLFSPPITPLPLLPSHYPSPSSPLPLPLFHYHSPVTSLPPSYEGP